MERDRLSLQLWTAVERAARRLGQIDNSGLRKIVGVARILFRPLHLEIARRLGPGVDGGVPSLPALLPGEPAPIMSYAQNAEDVVLFRAFADVNEGFYVDVGASDPEADSVTKLFYDRGWHGVNIEPQKGGFHRLSAARPRDVNLNVAVSNRRGDAKFFVFSERPGRSTLTPDLAELYRSAGHSIAGETVKVTTLSDICEQFAPSTFEFLKIDVEGHEKEVLLGADWGRFRPTVVVVEATYPDRWEDILQHAGYRRTLFDGVNAFYLAAERSELAERLAAPASSIDNYVPYRYQSRIDAAHREIAALQRRVAKLENAFPLRARRRRASGELLEDPEAGEAPEDTRPK